MISLNQLNTFYFAAKYLSFQDAAKHLNVSASAVSHQIKNLEGRLNSHLFYRKGRTVNLTARGHRLFEQLTPPIESLHKISSEQLATDQQPSLTVSVAPVFASSVLFPNLASFYAEFPKYSINLVASTELVNLNYGEIDCVIRLSKNHLDGLIIKPLKLVVVCSPRCFDTQDPDVISASLESIPRVENLALPDMWRAWFTHNQIDLAKNKKYSSVSSMSQVVEVLMTSKAIGLIDEDYASIFEQRGDLIVLSNYAWKTDWCYQLVAAEKTKTNPVFTSFSSWLAKLV